ncbi:helicase [Bacillus amyloliquefaciens]|nr:DNA helicase [Bacillus amyloliquefaciens]AZV90686.1 helicase [Bacillus amyloliquefaciens]OBR31967.1 DNA helicase [Bacillus amyloliquefaciens]GLW41940.1 hypothetical protein Bamy01_15850 [Bacillus amyloliquefaciens]
MAKRDEEWKEEQERINFVMKELDQKQTRLEASSGRIEAGYCRFEKNVLG